MGLALAAAVVVSACGSSGSGGSGDLTMAFDASVTQPPNLDVQMSAVALGSPFAANVYEGLTKLDADGEPQMLLAETLERSGDTTWTAKVREGVKFENGEPFTPEAAVFSIKRAVDEKSENLPVWSGIKDARVTGPNSVEIETNGPDPDVPRELSFLYMVPPKMVKENPKAFETRGSGTGPYKIDEWVRNQSFTLSPNSTYRGEQPEHEQVTIKVIPDAGVRTQALRAGEVEFISAVPVDDAESLPKVFSRVTNEVCMLRLNAEQGVFADQRLRQAANYAVNRDDIIQNIYGSYAAKPHAQIITEASFGFNKALEDYPYDPAIAKALLKAAGYSGEAFEMLGEEGRWPSDRVLQLAVVSDLQKAGFNVKVNIAEADIWVKGIFEDQPRPPALFICSSDDNLGGTKILESLATPDGAQSAYANPDVAAQIQAAQQEFDDTERAQMLNALWDDLKTDAPFLPIAALKNIWGASQDVEWSPRLDGVIYFDTIGVGG